MGLRSMAAVLGARQLSLACFSLLQYLTALARSSLPARLSAACNRDK